VGKGGVQPRPFARQEVSFDDFADQGVTDVVAVFAGSGHQQLAGNRLPQRTIKLPIVQAGHGRKQLVGHLPTGHRNHLEHPPGRLGQRLDPAAEQVAQGRRQLARTSPHGRQ
jgi:hypothetical protein